MNENERYEKLNDYVDGVLSGADGRAIEAELERDPALREDEQALRALLAEAARLPKGAVPRRDLWPEIASQLSKRAPARRQRSARRIYATVYRASLAAAAAIVIFFAGIWYARNEPPVVHAPPDAESANVATPMIDNAPQVELASYTQIKHEYAEVREALHDTLDAARPNLAPETIEVVDDSLATIDGAIREIETALEKDPGNHGLIRSLVAVYDQEVGLLRQVSKIAEHPGENNA